MIRLRWTDWIQTFSFEAKRFLASVGSFALNFSAMGRRCLGSPFAHDLGVVVMFGVMVMFTAVSAYFWLKQRLFPIHRQPQFSHHSI